MRFSPPLFLTVGVLLVAPMVAGPHASATGADGADADFTWVQQQPSTNPGLRGAALAHDPVAGLTYLFGGQPIASGDLAYSDETWTWDGATWTVLDLATRPPGRVGASMAYDPVCDEIVMASGVAGEIWLSDTWVLKDGQWIERQAADQPCVDGGESAIAYDPRSQRVICFSGFETAAWDGTRWDVLAPSSAPPDRRYPTLALDLGRDALITYGGYGADAETSLRDTWMWNGRRWIELDLRRSPSPRINPALFSAPGSVALSGGYGRNHYPSSTWVLRRDSWHKVADTGPGRRAHPSAVWDSTNREALLVGGSRRTHGVFEDLDDTWTLARR